MAGRPPKEKSFANMLRIALAETDEKGNTKLRATVAAWKDHGHVTVILHGLEAAGSVTVPFEFLKAAE